MALAAPVVLIQTGWGPSVSRAPGTLPGQVWGYCAGKGYDRTL